jgi:spermidine synthase
MMELIPYQPKLTQAQFLADLIERFPAVAADVLEEEGLIHLQVSAWARYANTCLAHGQLEEVARIIEYFQHTVEQVDSTTENALYVSFLEHLEFSGASENAKQARQLLAPQYLEIWHQLRAWLGLA